jgi:4-diphosphocytidyl-2-C-methyl-D-erythritol kinase
MTLRALYDVPAPAKLNLFLHVIGRRPDGYHLLQSVFRLIDWADRLHFERREDGRLERHDLGPALPADDLSLRAARTLQAASGTTLGADIHMLKQVPWGAGMGGGSSDAASTLLALNRLWQLDWPRARLAEIGLTIGADVPFFIGGRNAFVEGIGERLTPLSLPQTCYAVVKPAAAIDTRSIFTHPKLRRDTEAVILLGSLEGDATVSATGPWGPPAGEVGVGVGVDWEGFGRNDLQPPAEDHCPQVAQAARWLEARFGNSRMTGSGSAVFARIGPNFGMAATPEAMPGQQALDDMFEDLPAGWVGRRCRGLDQHPLVDWARSN